MKRKASLGLVLVVAACGTSTLATPDAGPEGGVLDASFEAAPKDSGGGDGHVPNICDTPGEANVDAASLPACAHDPSVVPDAAACQAARAFVVCCSPGVIAECISDDPTSCAETLPDGGKPTCTSHCAENEYAVECPGGVTPAGGCRRVSGPFPGGGETISCCPCK